MRRRLIFLIIIAVVSATAATRRQSSLADPAPVVRKPTRAVQQALALKRNGKEPDPEMRLLRALQKRISVQFQDVPLKEAVKQLSAKCNINIVVDSRGLTDEGISPEATVTFSANGVRLSTLLDRLLGQVKLDYAVADEVIKITSRVRAKGELITRTYNIAELVDPFDGVQVAAYNEESDDGQPAVPRARRLVGDLESAYGRFAARLQKQVRPESWEQAGGPGSATFYTRTGTLVIRQTQDVHEEVREFLEGFQEGVPAPSRTSTRRAMGVKAR